jgi:alanine racemase
MDKVNPAYYTSRLEINLDTIGENVARIRNCLSGMGIIPVIKSNAYGFGTVAIARYLVEECGLDSIAVARLYEACQILEAGIHPRMLMLLGPLPDASVPLAVEKNIEVPLFRSHTAALLSETVRRLGKEKVPVQLAIETGMNRIGVRPGKELEALLQQVKQLGNLEIDGVFTHFATADDVNQGKGNAFTRTQFRRFCEALSQVRRGGFSPRFIHCCNSGASVWLREAASVCTHIRTGSLLLGYAAVQDDWNPIGVEEPASWKTTIVNLREIQPGESVGYDRAFCPDRPARVAVIAVGYGDGYSRRFAVNGAPALVRGRRVPFVGTCMDMSFLDVSGVECEIGDEVTLFGDDGTGHRISGLEIGHLMGETRLAMFTHITERVARVYFQTENDQKTDPAAVGNCLPWK